MEDYKILVENKQAQSLSNHSHGKEAEAIFQFNFNSLVKHIIITNNKLISTSVQKGCMDKVAYCWKHISMVGSAIIQAHSTRSSSANIWVKANAYELIVISCSFWL